jgi:hypothetical protein
LGPWPGYIEKPINGDPIPARGSPTVREKWGKRFRISQRSRGLPVLRKRGVEAASRWWTEAGGGASRAAMVFRWPEGKRVAGK